MRTRPRLTGIDAAAFDVKVLREVARLEALGVGPDAHADLFANRVAQSWIV